MIDRTSERITNGPTALQEEDEFVEVIVNIPIRRSFRQEEAPPPDVEFGGIELDDDRLSPTSTRRAGSIHQRSGGAARYQTFEYHLPPVLKGKVQPGHLVWVPFGSQEVQGVVVRTAPYSTVETKPVARLARPLPVLTRAQLELAFWVADYYIAPVSEAVKLFFTPGLLTKEGSPSKVRAKREEQVELLIEPAAIRESLFALGRDTKQALILTALLSEPDRPKTVAELKIECNLSSADAILKAARKESD